METALAGVAEAPSTIVLLWYERTWRVRGLRSTQHGRPWGGSGGDGGLPH